MNLRSNSTKNVLLVIVLLAVSCVSAQESVMDTDKEESNGSVVDLGRRGKLILEKGQRDATNGKNDPGSVVLDLSLDSGLGVFDAFFASFSIILVSEIGDETFIIAALMAMRHPKSIVLSGALSALFVMTFFMPFLGCGCYILHGDQIHQKHLRKKRWRR